MRFSLPLLLLLLCLCGVSYSQRNDIPKGADRIKVSGNLPDSTLFGSIQSYLNDKGFLIEKIDHMQKTLTTEYKSAKGLVQIRIMVNVKEGSAIFRGQGQAQAMGFRYTNEPLLFKGSSSGLVKGGVISLNEVVEEYARKNDGMAVHYLTP